MSIYYVYQLVDPETNIPFYIGKGKNDRAKTHLWGNSKTNNPRKDAKINEIRNRGQEPLVQYIYENLTEIDAYATEEILISKFGRIGFETNGILVNLKKDAAPPSQKGKKRVFTEEHKRRLSESLKGKSKQTSPWNKGLSKNSDARLAKMAETRSQVGNSHQIGKKYSKDRIEKIKNSLTGRKMTDEQKSKMSNAKKGRTWEEIYGVDGAAARRLNRSKKE